MKKTLGLDLGTNSIGWAIKQDNQFIDKGVLVFPQGVGEEKGVEYSLASERTKHRSTRKLYRRRKQRKVDLLKLLIAENMCPLTQEELEIWAVHQKGRKKKYPNSNQEFIEWLALNPYEIRKKASERKITREELGRALYHICQRRGFKSGRKDADKGKDVDIYNNEKEERGNKTLGAYLHDKIEAGEKVRKTKYKADDNEVNSSRISYAEEFHSIITKQNISKELTDKLYQAIFFQRPLKSQKGTIGKCRLEKNSPRCAVSHPLFEEFRMLQYLNSIKIKNTLGNDKKFRFLSEYNQYFDAVKQLFFRKSKPNFKFLDVSKAINKLAKKNNEHFICNYKDKYPIVGSPTITQFITVFEAEDWQDCKEKIKTSYKLSDKKSIDALIDELWNALFFASNFTNDITESKVKTFIKKRYAITDAQVDTYEKISLKQGYGALSKKAIKKILPFLQHKVLYSYAVFFANVETIIGKETYQKNAVFIQDTIQDIIDSYQDENLKIDIVNGLVGDFIKEYDNSDETYTLDKTDKKNVTKKLLSFYGQSRWERFSFEEKETIQQETEIVFEQQIRKRRFGGYFLSKPRLDEKIKQFLISEFNVSEIQTEKLYHPSAIDVYPASISGLLESPATSSVRNPMAMRTLHQLKHLINDLIKNNRIDAYTEVIIELARELNDKNKRLAIERYQREREKENIEYRKRLEEHQQECGATSVTDADILKFRLWEEQNHQCIYTNKRISICDIFGRNPKFDIEHTFPRSKSFDNSLVNKTLCEKNYNQKVKGNKIPFELKSDYQTILNNVQHFKEKAEELKSKIEQQKYFSKVASTKNQKDKAIQQRHYLQLQYNYFNKKYKRFTAEEIHPKFKNSQLVDTGVITKYAQLFLKTLFKRVFPAKGTMVADIRQSWGLPKKDRSYHYHHAIDAMILTCMTKDIRDRLALAFHQSEAAGIELKFKVDKPWTRLTEDILKAKDDILVVHHHPSNLLKQTKRKLRKRNKIQRNIKGEILYEMGQGIRGSLHKDTFYGAIKKDENIIYVVRKWASDLTQANIKNIVDEGIKERINKHGLKNVKTEKGFIRLPAEEGKKEMVIKKIRLKTNFKNLPTIKKQGQISQKNRKEYKENYYATLETIFAMAVYEKINNKGKRTVDYKTISALEVSKYNKGKKKLEIPLEKNILKNKGKNTEQLLPLKNVLQSNQLVLFYKDSIEELYRLSIKELSNRLYKIMFFESGDGRIQLRHHSIAMQMASTNKDEKTIKKMMQENNLKNSAVNFENPVPWLRLSLGNFKAIVEGIDFEISKSGIVIFLKPEFD